MALGAGRRVWVGRAGRDPSRRIALRLRARGARPTQTLRRAPGAHRHHMTSVFGTINPFVETLIPTQASGAARRYSRAARRANPNRSPAADIHQLALNSLHFIDPTHVLTPNVGGAPKQWSSVTGPLDRAHAGENFDFDFCDFISISTNKQLVGGTSFFFFCRLAGAFLPHFIKMPIDPQTRESARSNGL